MPISHTQDITRDQTDPVGSDEPSGSVQNCRAWLLELHSLLLRELHYITDADLARVLVSAEEGTTSVAPSCEARISDANIVRRVLFASECLVELLERLSILVTTRDEHGQQSPPLLFLCGRELIVDSSGQGRRERDEFCSRRRHDRKRQGPSRIPATRQQ